MSAPGFAFSPLNQVDDVAVETGMALLRDSLCNLCVLCVTVVKYFLVKTTTETQRTQRLHREEFSKSLGGL
jgi:ferredoxin